MKKSRFSEEKIIAILKELEAGVKAPELARKHGVSEATLYIYGLPPICKPDLRLTAGRMRTSIRRHLRVRRAPGWEIRTRTPLQLAGPKGPCTKQVPCASVRPVCPS
jgi:putative transposase